MPVPPPPPLASIMTRQQHITNTNPYKVHFQHDPSPAVFGNPVAVFVLLIKVVANEGYSMALLEPG